MPCIFNRWHYPKWDYGGTYMEDVFAKLPQHLDYVRALVTPLAKDPRLLLGFVQRTASLQRSHFKRFSQSYSQPSVTGSGALPKPWRAAARGSHSHRHHEWREYHVLLSAGGCALRTSLFPRTAHVWRQIIGRLQGGMRVKQEGKPLLVNECVPGSEVERDAQAQPGANAC